MEYTVIVATRDGVDGRDSGEFLMTRHRDRGWELPGGRLEAGEGPVHCALREFREETGHLLSDPKFVLKLERDDGICFVFTGRLGPRVQDRHPEEVIEEMAWYDALPDTGLAFPDDPYDEMGAVLGIRFR